jgi:hypothetical protein
MQRRKFIAGLGSLAAAGAAGIGTGAFTQVTATRNVDVKVAGDNSAYLRLAGTGGANSAFVTDDGSGSTLSIDLDASNSTTNGGEGVNPDAVTQLDQVFEIKNQGTQEVELSISKSGDNSGLVEFHPSTSYGAPISSNPLTLSAGGTETISIEIDTEDESVSDGDELLDSVTFTAEATSGT